MVFDDERASGYICLWRKITDSAVFQNEGLFKVWCWCLVRGNWQECDVPTRTGRGETIVHLMPGQFIYGRHSAAKALKMKSPTVQSRMKKLEKMGNIIIQSITHYSIITIVNWEHYQSNHNGEHQPIHHPSINQASPKYQPSITDNKDNHPKHPKHPKTTTSATAEKDVFARAFKEAFDKQFPEPYAWIAGDFVQFGKWRKAYPAVTVERFLAVARECWSKGQYTPKASLTIRGLCAGWSTLAAKCDAAAPEGHYDPTYNWKNA